MNAFSSSLNSQSILMNQCWPRQGEVASSPVSHPSENSNGEVTSQNMAEPCSLTVSNEVLTRSEDNLNHWISVKEERVQDYHWYPFFFYCNHQAQWHCHKSTVRGHTSMHLSTSSVAGSVSGNVMITIGSKEGPACLKADVFQITSFGLIKTLLLPTDFSFVLHMNTRY